MPAQITLRVVQGELSGQEFAFDERTTCIIGRHKDCSPRIPNDAVHKTISRHHCLLDINPPDIRIRDFGSRNGTHVNGKKIGQREKGQTAEEAAKRKFPEYDLKDGDEIRLQKTAFKVSVFVPTVCSKCSVEIAEPDKAAGHVRENTYLCPNCRKERAKPPSQPTRPKCLKCGRDVLSEIGDNRQGDYICQNCKKDPWQLLKKLLGLANQGQRDLLGIKGYSVLKELDRGGMGAVYLARNIETNEEIALKIMLPQVAVNERGKEAFLRETRNTQALSHQHIVKLLDSGCSQGTFFLTLEFCDGGNVDDLMKRRDGLLSIDEALKIIFQVLDGLEYAHRAEIPYVKLRDGKVVRGRGLVHRDLKPHNIFLTTAGGTTVAKVGDYGLSKAFDMAGLSGHTCTGEVAGTPCFMPRQQIINFRDAKPEVDVWAAAASLYCMLTGAPPRDFSLNRDIWQIVLQTSAVPIRKRKPGIPKRLAEVIDHALVDNPEIGFKSADQFKRALQQVV
jgi:serine/threonine-protein kinase